MWLVCIGVTLIGYAFGSVPFGYLAGRANNIDIRTVGSFNVGATNVLRTLGPRWGFTVFFADALKGFAAVRVAILLAKYSTGDTHVEFYAILAAASCVAGHAFPVWLRFKGGKGVATSAGAILGIMPIAAITIFLVWLLVFQTTRYVSLASVIAAAALPLVVAALIWSGVTQAIVLLYFSMIMTALVIWRHRSNLSRLLDRTEPRFVRK